MERKNFFIIGCGRWGSFITKYVDGLGHNVTLYGRKSSKNMQQLMLTRGNGYLTLPDTVRLTDSIDGISDADIIIISIDSQSLDGLMTSLERYELKNKTFVLCMKGIVIETGERLSQVVKRHTDASNSVAVWLGPGHVQSFCNGQPNCMVIDSECEHTKRFLISLLSSNLIRFYYGTDLIGNEIGAALKNVMGIAAGMLDGMGLTALKGALMARGTAEVGRLIQRLGGKSSSAYGLCHLGDYEATLFSEHSHNRMFGELYIKGEPMNKLAEGYYTVRAIAEMKSRMDIDMPICEAIYRVLYKGEDTSKALLSLFERELKNEF